MAFQPTDLYLPSGTGQLINNWVDPVYKFDSSSFYNWEQDNIPIYDLEDRDDFLHEMAGYPTSAVDGIMLTVSDCGIDNKKVFGTIADAVEALPNTIRFPVIIEVCTSGQLGGMHIENREFEGSSAGLEIINRGFAKVLCGSSTLPSATIETLNGGALTGSSIVTFSSIDLSNTMLDSSSLGVSDTVWQNNAVGAWKWWDNFTRTFVLTPEWSDAAAASERTVTISTKFGDTAAGLLTGTNTFTVGEYSDNSTASEPTITNPNTGALVQRDDVTGGSNINRTIGFVYANAVSGVTVKDCGGRVFIRGFCVDGADSYELTTDGVQRTDIGFDIQNSDVLIENCTATRCRDAGMRSVNSNVILNRGFIASFNYELTTVGTKLDTKVTRNPTPGLKAINSNITLSATPEDKTGLPIDSPFCFYKNMVGVELTNSVLQTPPDYRYGRNVLGESPYSFALGTQALVLQSFFNMNEGIKALNSTIDTGQNISVFQNDVGISLNGSVCKVAVITADHNRNQGLLSVGSEFNYNQHAERMWGSGPFYPVTNFDKNGQQVVLSKSTFVPTQVEAMDVAYERLSFTDSHGMILSMESPTYHTTLPAVVVTDGSHMEALGTRAAVLTKSVDGSDYMVLQPVKGSMFRVTKGSSLTLAGLGTDATMIFGPYDSAKQQKTAALYAGENSHIKIAGPTSIVQFGVNALAEDNSTVEFGPHEKDGVVNASGYSLENTANHTKVQLHSTRATLVANRNSNIYMHDLGDYHNSWSAKHLVNAEDYLTNRFGTSALCSDGFMQFYANPYAPYGNGVGQLQLTSQAGFPSTTNLFDDSQRTFFSLPTTDGGDGSSDVSSLSYGGMCVRAVGDSQVTVRNVSFPTGWDNPSGPYYDVSTNGNCDLLRIWNIADNSELHASFLTVSGLYPEEASGIYYGPSAVWTSGGVGGVLSGAPSSTVDTSGLSVLDSFGKGVDTIGDLGFYGRPNFENIGPFRIYVSPHPKAKWLGYVSGTGGFYMPPQPPAEFISLGFNVADHIGEDAILKDGAPYQLFAQGYATSSDCSALDPATASGIYQDLGLSGYIVTLPADQQVMNVASSFFYTSAMLPCDNESRIWLDESAMNTFANAKNGTLGTSGRKKILSYYKAITDYPGEGWWKADSGFGIGLGSANLFDLDREL
jgi:hypothetical protein